MANYSRTSDWLIRGLSPEQLAEEKRTAIELARRELCPRNLDGCYFCVKHGEKYEDVCFSDLTEDERFEILKLLDKQGFRELCCHLADCLRNLGDKFDIVLR